MISDDVREEATRFALGVLRTHEPESERAAWIRARSLARLDSRRRPEPRSTVAAWHRALGPAVVGLAAAAYLADVVRLALRLYGF